MTKLAEGPRILVWIAMADQFLDTEMRHDIPTTALRCVEAGLSKDDARAIWRHEVSPAVSGNAWAVAGEWAGWDRDWLVAELERRRRRWEHRRGWSRWLCDRLRVEPLRGVWLSVERCMDALLAVSSPEERERLARDLVFLARHGLDFGPRDPGTLENTDLERIRGLYPEPFRSIIGPALVSGESGAMDERLRAALQAGS